MAAKRPGLREHETDIVDLYTVKMLSTYKIAKIYDTTDVTIGNILAKNGVKLRSISDGKIAQRKKLETRFWERVRKTRSCWIWSGAKSVLGYGYIYKEGEYGPRLLAHRLSWELANGAIPIGMEVCHKCDNPKCVRPSYLFVGTHLENMHDMGKKGRAVWSKKER